MPVRDPAGFAAAAFLAACRAELQALKPGNVHVFAPGHGMDVRHFEDAAAAAAPVIAAPGLTVGARIGRAVEASLAAAGCNTNLGIVLLSAPLIAAAAGETAGPCTDTAGAQAEPATRRRAGLRQRLVTVLAGLDMADAQAAFAAITRANPGGLGASETADVRAPARIDLRAAMALAADRDRIARQYVTDFADVFEIGVPALETRPDAPHGVENAYLALLAAFPDSHIARKFDDATAEGVRREADQLRRDIATAAPAARRAALAAFDTRLKARGLNPGTTADLTVASILAALLAL
ncbi:triphosphoribosyl-dephospho-CoA synthase [Xanthobacter sp. V4C-4]|uniref:triphosphoribosyl-dephospho-CoA synthase n=1 Tax=Xanthobacter cornucopiae TaxID=3119924 RepID=UPI00372A4075